MKKRFSAFFNTIFTKFALAFIVVGLLPLGVMSYVVLGKVPEALEKYTVNNFEQMLLYASSNVEKKISDYDNSTKMIYKYSSGVNGQLDDLLRNQATTGVNITHRNNITQDLVRTVLYSDQFIENVFLLDSNAHLLNYETKSKKVFDIYYDFKKSEMYQQTLLNAKNITIISSHMDNYFLKSQQKVMTFSRNYMDISALPDQEIVRGTLILDVNVDVFNSIFNRLSLGDQGEIFLLDGQGQCVYSRNHEQICQSFKDYLSAIQGYQSLQEHYVRTSEGYLFFQPVEGTQWMIVADIPKTDIINQIQGINQFIRVILIACSFGLIFVAMIFSRSLSRPIKSIIKQMKKVESGNFDIKVEVSSHDEVRQLAETFNKMTSELNDYINKAYVAQIKQREAELMAIKTQISPHYLYNTLEVIRMSALEEEAPTAADMICALSEQLKYIIGYSDDIVTLGQELENITHYFNILKVRFEERFVIDIEIAKDFYRYKILKLILQPIVENAVMHGLKPKTGKGKLMIKAIVNDQVLELSVYDDGVGMDKETLEEVKQLLEGDKMGKQSLEGWESIGIKNVHDRLRLKFGDGYGIEITSKKQLGTVVKIKMPLIEEVSANGEIIIGG